MTSGPFRHRTLARVQQPLRSLWVQSRKRSPDSNMAFHPIAFLLNIIQFILDKIFSPNPPPPNATLRRPRIAVIGAGLTGVSSAAHCVGHGFDVVIFEAGGKHNLGGIWSRVNTTSGLQIHSLMYRFHPSV